MTHTWLDVAHEVVSLTVLGGAVCLLARRPYDARRWSAVGLIGGWALAYPLSLAASTGTSFLGADALTARYAEHVLMLLAAFSLVCFFQFAAAEVDRARRRVAREAAVVVVALAVLTVACLTIPEALRIPAATVAVDPADGPVGEPAVAAFYMAANGYLLYVALATGRWTRRYAKGAEPRLRRGLRVASGGLAAVATAEAVLVLTDLSRLAGSPAPAPVVAASAFLFLTGLVVFFAGMAHPSLAGSVPLARVWLRHHRDHRRLRPLWTILNERFPQDALNRTPVGPWRDVLRLRGVHRHYYRRVIECRDGLVRISPYLASLATERDLAEPEPLARRLADALRDHAAGKTVPPQAIPVAVPGEGGLRADTDRLVELADAVRRTTACRYVAS